MPTRFKYTTVPQDSYALTAAEILMATDQELNEYMSIKRLAPYKNKNSWDKDRNQKLLELREKIGSRTWDGHSLGDLNKTMEHRDNAPKKKRKGKKERQKLKQQNQLEHDPEPLEDEIRPKKRRKQDEEA